MTIDGLSGFLRDRVPGYKITLHLSRFRGQRLAIDANNWMYSNLSIAQKKVIDATSIMEFEPNRNEIISGWLRMMIQFNQHLTKNSIVPVWVFDGPHAKQKSDTQRRRAEKKEDLKSEVDQLLTDLKMCHPLEITTDKVIRVKKLLSQIVRISGAEETVFRDALRSLGVIQLSATGEAEKLCSMLCRDELVGAVLSTDSDTLAYLCPITINRLSRMECEVVLLDRVMTGLKLHEDQFVEFCILLGCDYNCRIPKFGPVRGYNYIMGGSTLAQLSRETLGAILTEKRDLPELELTAQIEEVEVDYCVQEFKRVPSSDVCIHSFPNWEMNSGEPMTPSLTKYSLDVPTLAVEFQESPIVHLTYFSSGVGV